MKQNGLLIVLRHVPSEEKTQLKWIRCISAFLQHEPTALKQFYEASGFDHFKTLWNGACVDRLVFLFRQLLWDDTLNKLFGLMVFKEGLVDILLAAQTPEV